MEETSNLSKQLQETQWIENGHCGAKRKLTLSNFGRQTSKRIATDILPGIICTVEVSLGREI